ncbi:MAG: CRTAC1 family protein [Pseudomonadota bacterium]
MSEQPRPDTGDEQQDDAIIGKALRGSLLVLAGIAALAAVAWFAILRQEDDPAPVEEAAPIAVRDVEAVVEREAPALPFTDVTAAAGIDFVHRNGAYGERLLPETMGGGVAFFDFDADGDMDLAFVDSGAWPWRGGGAFAGRLVLYLNDGTGNFAAAPAGTVPELLPHYGMGIAVADVDGDGWTDVFVTGAGPNVLLRNDRGRRLVDGTVDAGVAGGAEDWSTSAAFLDHDRDGDLDLFVTNYVTWSRDIDIEVDYRLTGIGRAYGPPTNYAGTLSRLYVNDGSGRFDDVTDAAGIAILNPATGAPAGKGLAVLPADFDGDGWIDLAVANDTVQNFLFLNQQDGTFVEAGALTGVAFDNSGSATGAMGIDALRFGDSGETGIAIDNFANEMTSFYVAPPGDTLFSDLSVATGVGPDSRQALSFGLFFFDVDLDGRLDLLQTNGHVEDEINVVQPSQNHAQSTQLFWQCGLDCARRFLRVPESGLGDLPQPVVGRGAAYADIDADGDLDVVLTQVARPPLLLRNDQTTGHAWLRVALRGDAANPRGIGAELTLTTTQGVQHRTIMPTRSYLSQVEPVATFGLAAGIAAESLQVRWPDGTLQETAGPIGRNEVVVIEKPL